METTQKMVQKRWKNSAKAVTPGVYDKVDFSRRLNESMHG